MFDVLVSGGEERKVSYFEPVFRSGIAILDLTHDWSPVMRLPLIYSFLINISKSFTVETRMRPTAGLPQKGNFLPPPGSKEKTNWKKKFSCGINTLRLIPKGEGTREEGCWGVARSQWSISHRNGPKPLGEVGWLPLMITSTSRPDLCVHVLKTGSDVNLSQMFKDAYARAKL